MNAGARALGAGQASLFDAVPELLGSAPRVRQTRTAPFIGDTDAPVSGAVSAPVRPVAVPESLPVLRARLLNSARQRALLLTLAFAALALVAMVQIVWLGLDGAGSSSRAAASSQGPKRGEIVDRNGVPLAREHPAYSLYFFPDAMKDGGQPLVRSPEEIARKLKAIFPHLNEEATARKLASGEPGYLLRRILPEEANAVWRLGEVAVQTPEEPDRHYPQGRLASHVLGRVIENDDGVDVGAFGMEAALEAKLTGASTRAAPQALSIDVRVQGALEDEMRRGMKLAKADGAAGLVLDVETGELLAMASLPDFDPNRIAQEDANNTLNRASFHTVELGSVFKPLTVAAAIDQGIIRDLGKIWDATPVEAGGRVFTDHEDKGPELTIPEALAYSSNTVTMRVAEQLGPQGLDQAWAALGLKAPPVLEIQAKGTPRYPEEEWNDFATKTASYGHGFNVTPLHLANAYAAMVNGGIFRPATLLKVEPGKANPGTRVFKASTSLKMRQLLRLVALRGTGTRADATGFRVGGKTGSAEKWVGTHYSKTRIISTFAAAFPMDRPRYVVVVSLDEPKITDAMPARTAYWNAAPIVGQVISRTGPMLGVKPDNVRDVDISDLDHLVKKKK